MAHDDDDDKKGKDKGSYDRGHKDGKNPGSSSEDLYDYRKHGDGFNKSDKNDGWITRPTTSETPILPPSTSDTSKDE